MPSIMRERVDWDRGIRGQSTATACRRPVRALCERNLWAEHVLLGMPDCSVSEFHVVGGQSGNPPLCWISPMFVPSIPTHQNAKWHCVGSQMKSVSAGVSTQPIGVGVGVGVGIVILIRSIWRVVHGGENREA